VSVKLESGVCQMLLIPCALRAFECRRCRYVFHFAEADILTMGDDAIERALQEQMMLQVRPRLALDVEVITCRFQSKRAQIYIRLQLFPSTFR
jgi:hypothetical protein